MSSHAKTILLIVILFILIVLSIVYYVSVRRGLDNRNETLEERLMRESAPGEPIIISPEDQERLIRESQPQ